MEGRRTSHWLERLKKADRRLLAALSCYGAIALAAALALDGVLRGGVVCFVAILAVKTIAHANDRGLD